MIKLKIEVKIEAKRKVLKWENTDAILPDSGKVVCHIYQDWLTIHWGSLQLFKTCELLCKEWMNYLKRKKVAMWTCGRWEQ